MNTPRTIVDLHSIDSLGPTFIGLQLVQLSDIIDWQGDKLFSELGHAFPSRCVSTLIFLSREKPATVTEIAVFLGISHQLVGHRLKELKSEGLVQEQEDPSDSRRRLISLTRRGKTRAAKVAALCGEIEQVFGKVFSEIGINLFDALIKAKTALADRDISMRLSDARREAS